MRLPLPRWFAHRGGGVRAPENTLGGIRLAARLGFQAVEFDVMLSGDGTPVLIHDETLERTTNGRGQVCTTPDSVLFALDAGNGEPIPTLAEAAALCRELDLLANVEIKPASGHDVVTAERVARDCLMHWQGASQMPLLSSFSMVALAIARDSAPDLPRGLLFDRVPADWRQTLSELQAHTLHCNARHVSDELLAAARAAQVPVLCYTVNDAAMAARLLDGGVTALFTDCLAGFAAETSAYKGLHLGG